MKKENGFLLIGENIFSIFLILIVILPLLFIDILFTKVEVNTDINKYNDFMGIYADDKYDNKWGMDEEIFPKTITNDMKVKDYKMVYYNPWDAQYLSYLVVEYDSNNYKKEVKRLKEYNSTEYKGYYGVTGFSKYTLLAMYADSYNGFVYAITDNENTIIYVELIFCNYCFDIEYKDYIDEKYLPDGFDATYDNEYLKLKTKSN